MPTWLTCIRAAALAATAVCGPTAAQAPAPAPAAREQALAIDTLAVPAPVLAADLQRLARGLRWPWSLAFVPRDNADAEILMTEKHGGIGVWRDGALTRLAEAPANVLAKADSGLLDITLDPDFPRNRLVYVAFAEGDEKANRTAIWRARYDGHALHDGSVIFRSRPDMSGTGHPGGRLLFLPDGTLLLTMGDGFDLKSDAQDLGSHWGKTLRLTRDGRPAADNPFAGRDGALPEIWTLGHRNAQGLTRDAETGEIWLHEHGPRGGDEVNRLRAGANYGWPLVTHGIDYDGTLIAERAAAPGVERALFFWAPSIAPSGLAIYRGNAFPDWKGRLFIGGLASRSLVRLRIGRQTGLLVEEARMLQGLDRRIRDVREGPDGALYLLTDHEDGELLRLVPPRR